MADNAIDADTVVCFNCFFFDQFDNPNAATEGFCRRNAPRPHWDANDAYFPTVAGRTDWCGEFRQADDFTRVPPEPKPDGPE